MANNTIDETGIHIQTLDEILDEIINGSITVPGLRQIYGADINVDQNSPDGQMINIFALSKQDMLDLLVQIYDSQDPEQAVGVALDALCAFCGISRQAGSYTLTDIDVTTDRNLNLNGLDTDTPYTIQDANGNRFLLITSASLTTGVNTLAFQSEKLGNIQISQNTLTVPVTIILGVISVNNPSVPTQTGSNQETDAQLRIRRDKSTSKPAIGWLSSIYAALFDVSGVTAVAVYENNTNATNADGMPPHTIWVVVQGGSDDDVAQAIYGWRSAGVGMVGAQSVMITQVDATTFEINFDRAGTQNLYVRFHLDSLNSAVIDEDAVSAMLVAKYLFNLNQPADITSLTTLISENFPNLVVSLAEVSNDNIAWSTITFPLSKKNKFVLLVGNITYL